MDGHHDLLGWATPQLLDLDERVSYSIVSRLLRSGAMVRQAIWLTLAHQRPEDDRDQLAQVVAKGWARDMIAYTFGRVPKGLLPTLERIGGYPLDSRSYRLVWSIFDDPDQRKADVLRRLDGITDERLRVLDQMQGTLVHLRVLERTPTLAHLADLRHAIALIQANCTAATQDALVEAFDRM